MKQAGFAAAILLALFGWMAASVSDEHSATADEIFHLTAGYGYWLRGDYRLHAENGNFPQRWAALPLWWQRPAFPASDQTAWKNADAAEVGFQFFYEDGNDLARMLRTGRTMIALLGIALGVVVFAWSRSVFGRVGGLVSVAAFAFCPNLLAHAGLVTSDLAACLGFVLAVLTGWRLLHRVTAGRLLAAGAAFGFLALAKFSAIVFAPMLAVLFVARCVRSRTLPVSIGTRSARLRGARAILTMLAAQAVALAIAVAIVWAAFGFRFKPTPADTTALRYNQPWSMFYPPTRAVGVPLRVTKFAVDHRLLPEAYLYGFAHTLHFADGRPAYFLGDYRSTGWREFFPVAFLVKTSPAWFGLIALALAVGLRRTPSRRRVLYALTPLLVLLAVYWAFAVTSRLNIGHRHILVTYPVLAIMVGAVGGGWRHRWLAALTAGLLGWHAWTSLAIRPHYLAYFNPLLGGPSRAYRHFVDSSLDWGQDLPGLARWLQAHTRGEKVFLSYFGSGHPPYYGIRATRIGDSFFDLRERAVLPDLTGGVYCISATMFQQVYTLVRHGWSREHERRYQDLRQWVDGWHHGRDATARDAAIPRLLELEQLQFGRLCAGLRRRAPDDEVGYSILIFRLTDADLRRLLDGPPPFAG